jgi:trehalose/maltose transport system substrate-binding protein
MKIAGILGISLLLLCLGCSKPPAHEPVTVTFLDVEWDTPDRMPGLAKDLQDFTRETGIQVRRLPRPNGSLNQLALWRELLQKNDVSPDVLSIDAVWSGILDPYLMDLKPYFGSEISSENPVVVGSYTVGDKLVALPHHAYVGVLLFRPDLLRKYGYREPPKTWDELEKMSARIQAGERAKGEKDFWGYVWQGGLGEDLTCDGLEWQVSEGGGRIIENNKTISLNNPQTVRAWQRAKRWIGVISPPGVIAYEKWDAENIWSSGKAAFLRGWVSDYSLVHFRTPPAGATQFGVTSLPGGASGRAGTLGGNGLGISRNSAHPREALALVRFLRQRDVQLIHDSEHSEPGKEQVAYELPAVLQLYPQLPDLRRQGSTVVARPSIASGQNYEQVTRAYIQALHSALTGDKTPSAAAADLEKELIKITGFGIGPPSKLN